MNRSNALVRLALYRQQLDEYRRAMLPELLGRPAIGHIENALSEIGLALDEIDRPTITPESPWLTAPTTQADPGRPTGA